VTQGFRTAQQVAQFTGVPRTTIQLQVNAATQAAQAQQNLANATNAAATQVRRSTAKRDALDRQVEQEARLRIQQGGVPTAFPRGFRGRVVRQAFEESEARNILALQARSRQEERERRAANRRDFTQQARDARRDLRIQDQEAARQRRTEETRAAEVVARLGLRTPAQAAREAFRAENRPPLRVRGGGGGPIDPNRLQQAVRLVGTNLTNAFDKATRAANALGIVANVSLLGGLVGLVAEGIKLNAALERTNLTMAATLALSNDVVDSQGRTVEGAAKANALLRGTAGIYNIIRDVAAKSLLEQQELQETVTENLALAQRAGFRFNRLRPESFRPAIQAIANVAQIARAIGLPGGQRQTSQEVRALLLGERLQGATVARLLNFRSISEIQRLQARPGRQGPRGPSAFVEELTKRFQQAKPILDAFAQSATGVFTTLISQVKLFLQIATEAAFKQIVGVTRNLRDFLTDERVKSSAQEVGKVIGTLVRDVVGLGRALAPALTFFRFLAEHARELIAVALAFKGLQLTQTAAGFLGGRGGGAAGAAGAAGQAAAGVAGAAAPGFLGRFAAARGGLALGGAARLGLLGRLAGLGAAGGLAAGALPATLVGGAALTGLGVGAGVNFLAQGLPTQLGQRAGAGRVVEQVQPERAALVEPLLRTRERRSRLREFIRREGTEAAQFTPLERFAGLFGGGGFGGVLRRLEQQRGPDFGPKTTVAGARRAEQQLKAQEDQQSKTAKEAEEYRLRVHESALRQEQLQAKLAFAELNRDREAALKLQAKLEQENIITQFEDKKAAAIRLKALDKTLQRDLLELREDEALAVRQLQAESLQDEEGLIRLRTLRETIDARRRIRDKRQLTQTLAAIELQGRRALISQFLTRQGERAGVRGELATAQGRTLTALREEALGRVAQFGQQVAAGKATVAEFFQFYNATVKDTARREIEARQEVRDKARDFGLQIIDLAQQGALKRKEIELDVAHFQERLRDRDIENVKARLAEEVNLRRAAQARIDARVDESLFKRQRAAKQAAAQALQTQRQGVAAPVIGPNGEVLFPGGGQLGQPSLPITLPSVQQEVQRRLLQQIQRGPETRLLPGAQQGELAAQRAQEFIRNLVDTLLGEGGLEEAGAQLRGLGVNVTPGIRQQLAGAAITAGGVREDQRTFADIREAQQVRERTIDADQGLLDAQESRRERELQDRRSLRDEGVERQRLQVDSARALLQLNVEFGRTQDAIRKFAGEATRAGIALDQGLTRIFQTFLGARVPAPEAAIAGQAQQQLERAGAPRKPGETPTRNQRGEGGTTINLNIGQLGADTKKTLDTLKDQLIRDSRRTTA
jgi:hypothetical protein